MIPSCQQCGQEMTLQKQGKTTIKGIYKCRIRRFYCECCDITETIYADGYRDVVSDSIDAVDEVKSMHQR